MSNAGIAAARRKFTPEFINRLDKIVVFKSLGKEELRRIVDIELEMVQQRIEIAAGSKPFRVHVTDSAREFLLAEGTDVRYGARPLKRAIERLLVQPLSNLMATGQIRRGDRIHVSYSETHPSFYSSAMQEPRKCGNSRPHEANTMPTTVIGGALVRAMASHRRRRRIRKTRHSPNRLYHRCGSSVPGAQVSSSDRPTLKDLTDNEADKASPAPPTDMKSTCPTDP